LAGVRVLHVVVGAMEQGGLGARAVVARVEEKGRVKATEIVLYWNTLKGWFAVCYKCCRRFKVPRGVAVLGGRGVCVKALARKMVGASERRGGEGLGSWG